MQYRVIAILTVLVFVMGCSQSPTMELDPTIVLPPAEESQPFTYPASLLQTARYSNYVAYDNIGIRRETVRLGSHLRANTEDLFSHLFENFSSIDSIAEDNDFAITISPNISIDRGQVKVVFTKLLTTSFLTWNIYDADGELVDVIMVEGSGGGAAGYGIKPKHFYDSIGSAFTQSLPLLRNNYFLNEAEVCHTLYSKTGPSLSEQAALVLSDTRGQIEKQSKAIVMLCYAARAGKTKLLEYLIADGNSATGLEPYSGFSPAHFAARIGNEASLQALLEAGVDVNIPCAKGKAPIYYAGYGEKESTWKFLLDNGAFAIAIDDSSNYDTAILHNQFADYLLSKGESERAENQYRIAAEYYENTVIELDDAISSLKKKRASGEVFNFIGNAVASMGAQYKARQYARSMAEVSPSGKGYGLALYKQKNYDSSTSQKLQLELEQLLLECKDDFTNCQQLADDCKSMTRQS